MRQFRMRRDQSEMMLTWLQLARCEGVGPVTFTALLERYGSVAAALAAATRQPILAGGPGACRRGRRCWRSSRPCAASAVDW